MTHTQNSEDRVPWWQRELLAIETKHELYLKQKLPALRAYHDDLTADVRVAVTRQILRNASEFPVSWFQLEPPPNEEEKLHLHRLGMLILKRRIADLFRKRRRELHPHVSIDDVDVPDPRESMTQPDRKILLAKLIEVTSLILDEMPTEDRDLVALISKGSFRKALNDKERQRLHRIRKKLRREIARRLGEDVADLLRIPP